MAPSKKPPIFVLNPQRREQLFWMTTWIQLTPAQLRILCRLARAPGKVVTPYQLYQTLTTRQVIIGPPWVAEHISQIKAWCCALSGHQLPIEDIPDRGYRLNLPEMSVILVPEANHETS
jgi:DNA-binding response OmpR family regulator